jgi:hypothetical protein
MTNFIQALDGELYDIAPITFTLPSKFEASRLHEYMSKHKNTTYISKPQAGSQGDGMNLFKEMKDLPITIDN